MDGPIGTSTNPTDVQHVLLVPQLEGVGLTQSNPSLLAFCQGHAAGPTTPDDAQQPKEYGAFCGQG